MVKGREILIFIGLFSSWVSPMHYVCLILWGQRQFVTCLFRMV
jgi:hypothetical protein